MVNADEICSEILALDSKIRFAGHANVKGPVTHHRYRADIKPLLTTEETSKSMLQAVIREGMRTTLEAKLGQCVYSFAKYKNVKRVTVPLRPPTMGDGMHAILMISIEVDANHDMILEDKALPYLARTRINI